MRYYLDTPHSQIVDDAHVEFKKYGHAEAFEQVRTGIDPAMEHPESLAYQLQAEMFFFRHMGGRREIRIRLDFQRILDCGRALTPTLDAIHRYLSRQPSCCSRVAQ